MTIPLQAICAESSDVIQHECSFSGAHPVLREHFPGDPVVPAFLQLQHVRELACSLFDVRPECVRVKSVKFLAPLQPENSVAVRLERKSTGTLTFKLLRDGQTITHGEISVG